MRVSLLLALLSANSRLLMSFSRTLYLFICSQMISSTHLQRERKLKKQNKTRAFNDGITVSLKCSWLDVKSCPLQYKELPVSLTFPKNIPNCCKMPFKITEEDQEARQEVTASFAVAK